MAEQQMRSYEMTEIVARGLEECLTESFAIAIPEDSTLRKPLDSAVIRARESEAWRDSSASSTSTGLKWGRK